MSFSDELPQTTSQDACEADKLQEDFDIEFFSRVLQRDDTNTEILMRLAELHAKRNEYVLARVLDERLTRLRPNDCHVHYNLACSQAMTGELEPALATLDRALALGYQDIPHLETDSDLDAIRDLPGFRDIMAQHNLVD